MLSLAYGRDQNRRSQVHKPEVCYPAQGFQLSNMHNADLREQGRDIPVLQMTAQKENRTEHVQYWIVAGDRVIRGALQQNLYRAMRAMRGERTDGLLFRTSLIGPDQAHALSVQDDFIRQLLQAIPPAERPRFLGQ
jgi:EpsI family protein